MADKKNIALAMMTASLVLLSNGVQGDEVVPEAVQEEALSYEDLGSGEEVRSDLVAQTQRSSSSKKTAGGSCGTGTTGMTGTKSPGQGQCGATGTKKPAEGQCGEGKCGSGSQNSGGSTSSYKKGASKNAAGK